LQDDRRLSEPVEGLQRLLGRRRYAGDVPGELVAALRHQCGGVVRGAGPTRDAGVVGQVSATQEMIGPRARRASQGRAARSPTLPLASAAGSRSRTNDGRTTMLHPFTRRRFLAGSAAAGIAALGHNLLALNEQKHAEADKALIAVTLDLEMSRHFPTWETTHWDYEKGNLNDETKKYAAEACRRVKAAGGVLHCFVVGRVFEQENVDWLKDIAKAGHPLGNHTYDHVNVTAAKPEDIQFRFRRAPWLIDGKAVE